MTPRPLGTWDVEARIAVVAGLLLAIIAAVPVVAVAVVRLV